jgi:flagellar hook-length control protein FliK
MVKKNGTGFDLPGEVATKPSASGILVDAGRSTGTEGAPAGATPQTPLDSGFCGNAGMALGATATETALDQVTLPVQDVATTKAEALEPAASRLAADAGTASTLDLLGMGASAPGALRKGAGRGNSLGTSTSASKSPSGLAAGTFAADGAGSNSRAGDATAARATVDLDHSARLEQATTLPGGTSSENDESVPHEESASSAPAGEPNRHWDIHPTSHAENQGGVPAPEVSPDSMQDMMRDAMEQVGAQVTYWATSGTQTASLSIGDGTTSSPLEVNVSMSNGEVNVEFVSKEHALRDAMADNARDMLRAMLDGQGIALGQVSVGGGQTDAQQGAMGNGSGSGEQPRPLVPDPHATSATVGRMGAAVARAPIISANKLDIFA